MLNREDFSFLISQLLVVPLQPQKRKRAFSSVGLEHLPYKQRVGGSNPSTPTNKELQMKIWSFFFVVSEKSITFVA